MDPKIWYLEKEKSHGVWLRTHYRAKNAITDTKMSMLHSILRSLLPSVGT